MKHIYIKLATISFAFFFVLLMISCKKNEEGNNTIASGKVSLSIRASIDGFRQGNEISNASNKSNASSLSTFEETIEINKDYILIAELSAVTDGYKSMPSSTIISKDYNRAAENSSNLPTGIYYRLLVFKSDGNTDYNYVTSRDYQRNSESSTPDLLLDGGARYTFIAYSVNSINLSDLENISTSQLTPGTSTLANSYITVSDDQDLLFFKSQEVLITGEANQSLEILFKHMFSKITVSVNSYLTGYNIENIAGELTASNREAKLNFSNGLVSRTTGTAQSTALTFLSPSTATQEITATEAVINASSLETLKLTTLQIGTVTVSNLTLSLSNAIIASGVEYNLRLTISSQDAEFEETVNGVPYKLVRLHGKVWMAHNIGIPSNDYTIDPHKLDESIYGRYYQWGRNTLELPGNITFVSTPEVRNPSGWGSLPYLIPNSWNNASAAPEGSSQRENNPVKNTANDPCPVGFRVPTRLEHRHLIDNTTHSQIISTNFSGAGILTSKRKSDVKMTLPAQGYYSLIANDSSANIGALSLRGSLVRIWNSYYTISAGSTPEQPTNSFLQINTNGTISTSSYGNSGINTNVPMPVRCIKE